MQDNLQIKKATDCNIIRFSRLYKQGRYLQQPFHWKDQCYDCLHHLHQLVRIFAGSIERCLCCSNSTLQAGLPHRDDHFSPYCVRNPLALDQIALLIFVPSQYAIEVCFRSTNDRSQRYCKYWPLSIYIGYTRIAHDDTHVACQHRRCLGRRWNYLPRRPASEFPTAVTNHVLAISLSQKVRFSTKASKEPRRDFKQLNLGARLPYGIIPPYVLVAATRSWQFYNILDIGLGHMN